MEITNSTALLRALLGGTLGLLVACSGNNETDAGAQDLGTLDSGAVDSGPSDLGTPDMGEPDLGAEDTGPAACPEVGPQLVQLTTSDGIQLEADLYTTGLAGQPGVVLLHMIPPFNDRTNYPLAFIQALTSRGFNVLNVDRRGAGNSEGQAVDAYEGPLGKFDAQAAVDYLIAHECAIAEDQLVVIGASNGTTSALDYAIHANTEAGVSAPKGLVFLTGGGYTENQNRISAQSAVLDPLPIHFVYSTAERGWSAGFLNTPNTAWTFAEYPMGDHGTLMFNAAAESIEEVADRVQSILTTP